VLEAVAGTTGERAAIAAVAQASARGAVPSRVASRCAAMLAARGERPEALRFLERATEPQDLLMRADLLHESGRVPEALSLVERVLARDLDFPGARERHERWRVVLGRALPSRRGRDDVTIAVTSDRQAPFRILREVARGGAGAVYEARDELLGRTVAYKVYHRLHEDRSQCEREAHAAVELRGPGVVRVYDASFEQGWIALEWVPLGSLRELLAAGRHDELRPARRWALPLAEVLARVHRRGWVHADVKPANVLLRATSQPVLADFGIAAKRGEPLQAGSAGYLSPERMAGEPLECDDDVYGFGRVLEQVMQAAHGALDPGLEAVMHACLGPRGRRPRDGAALVRELT